MEPVRTQYAKNGDTSVAYQVFGEGDVDLVFVPGFISHIENYWDDPNFSRWLRKLGSFCRVIMFDKQGTGLSDRVGALPGMDERMDDVRAVMDAESVDKAALLGVSEGGRLLAERIPNAKFVELPGIDHLPMVGENSDQIVDEIAKFLTGAWEAVATERILATVLFTDIVNSTEMMATLGDRQWHDMLERHHIVVRRELHRFRGREVDTAGDGFFATFDGPARAIRCACDIRDAVSDLGIVIRAGLHTGECEMISGKAGGIAVHIGARVMHAASPGEILVSSTVKDLVAGSGLAFHDRGKYTLKGIPGKWRLFLVKSPELPGM